MYSARYHWVALETEAALAAAEITRLVRVSYNLVLEKLPEDGCGIMLTRADRHCSLNPISVGMALLRLGLLPSCRPTDEK